MVESLVCCLKNAIQKNIATRGIRTTVTEHEIPTTLPLYHRFTYKNQLFSLKNHFTKHFRIYVKVGCVSYSKVDSIAGQCRTNLKTYGWYVLFSKLINKFTAYTFLKK
jgi:hypothetical protein